MLKLRLVHLIEISIAIVLTLAALVFAFAVYATPEGEDERISVGDAWARPTLGEGRTSAAYLTIVNRGKTDVRLHAVEGEGFEAVEIHETKVGTDGVARMRKLDGLKIPAGKAVTLAPGGAHLMLIGGKAPLKPGDRVSLTLVFDSGESIAVEVPVVGETPAEASHHHHH